MERITKYELNDDGTYSLLIEGAVLGNDETLMLDNGISILADVKVHDPFKITEKQRKKIFALVKDIESATGQPREYMREMFQDYVRYIHNLDEPISLANCSKKIASKIIEVIIYWVFEHDIPLNYKTSDLMKEDGYFIYVSTINRTCVICGKTNSDLAHREAVGAGRDRNTMNHYNHHVLALCREHHSLQHEMGVKSFDRKYHLENAWIKVDDRLNKMLKGQKIN